MTDLCFYVFLHPNLLLKKTVAVKSVTSLFRSVHMHSKLHANIRRFRNSSRNYLRGNVHWGVPGKLNTCRDLSVGICATNRNLLRQLHELALCDFTVKIPTAFCVNVGIAAALVMYDRLLSTTNYGERPVVPSGNHPQGMAFENLIKS